MTTQKYKSLLVIIWALWAFHPCLAIDDVLRTAKRDAILAQITGAVRPKKQISLISFGAKGDGKKDCKPAFDKAMKRAVHMGGAHIVVPAGEYLLNGPIHFVSNVCLELQEGATLKFSSEPAFYLPLVKTSWEGTFLQNYSPFIYGYQLENVSIIGKGVIDGNAGTTFATWKSKQKIGQQLSREMNHKEVPVAERNFGEGYWLRPHLVQFFDCKNITIEDVFITNAPFWCIHLLKSENIICRGIRYDAKLVNNDGIDPEYTRNLLIENIEFKSEVLKAQYTAEARFLRALIYFYLNRIFGGYGVNGELLGAIKVDREITQTEAYDMGRVSLQEMYDLIIQDL